MAGAREGAGQARVFHSVTSVRGVAALAVCWFHMVVMTGLMPAGPLHDSAQIGWLGPHVFFIVSGFVVPWSLWVARYRWRHAPLYLARRIARLDPPYFASIGLILILDWLAVTLGLHAKPFDVDWAQLFSHMAYATGVLGEHWYQPVFWTLAIEFQFYLALAVVFPLLASPSRALRWALMAACLAVYLPWREVPELSLAPAAEFPTAVWVTAYLPLFMLGFVLFQRSAALIDDKEAVIWAGILVAIAATFTYALAPLAAIAFYVMRRDRLRNRVTEFLGRISYSLYLVHIPVGVPLQNLLARVLDSDGERAVLVVVSLGFCVSIAWLFHWAVERPSVRLARRLGKRPASRSAVAEGPAPDRGKGPLAHEPAALVGRPS